jgi:hypothetical protein
MTSEPEQQGQLNAADEWQPSQTIKDLMSRMPPPLAVEYAIVCATIFLWSRRIGALPDTLEGELREFDIEPSALLCSPDGTGLEWRKLIDRHHDLLISSVIRGWHHGRDVLCNYAEALEAEGEPWPRWLREFLIDATRDGAKARRERGRNIKGRKGQDPYGNVDRDYVIAKAIRFVVDLCDCDPTRNAATADRYSNDPTKQSGCSMVAKALQDLRVAIGEPGVNAIWLETKQATRHLLDRPLRRLVLGGRSDRRTVVPATADELTPRVTLRSARQPDRLPLSFTGSIERIKF